MRIVYFRPCPNSFFLFFISGLYLNAQPLNYFFGNLHAHTSYSDGNRDSLSTQITGPVASYNYAKLSQDFDFLGISEHNHFSTAKNPGFRKPLFQRGRRAADSLSAISEFLCLFGMEYGVSSENNGHVLIYGYDSLIGWESNVGGTAGPNYEVFNGRSDYAALFQKVARKQGAFAFLAHPYWTDFTTDGTDSSAIAFAAYNACFDSAIVGMPLRSGNAFSTFVNYGDYSPLNYFNYYKRMLNLGYHLGIGYDHDNHYSNFGRSNGGRLAVLMPTLSQSSLYAAIRSMRFYGSDDANARLDFQINSAIMGSILMSEHYPHLTIQHDDPDGEQADTIRIWKGFRGSNSWAFPVAEFIGTNICSYTDKAVVPGKEFYYFLELRQRDGQWMVSSPIWYTGGKHLGASVASASPVVQWQYLAGDDCLQFFLPETTVLPWHVSICSLSGIVFYEGEYLPGCASLDVSGLAKGMYLLRFQGRSEQMCFKFVR